MTRAGLSALCRSRLCNALARQEWKTATKPRWLLTSVVAAAVLTGACSRPAPQTPVAERPEDARAAMTRFVTALKAKDLEGFLQLFPRRSTWRYVGTATEPQQVSELSYEQLAADFQSQTGLYESLIYAGGDDCFRDHFVDTEPGQWVEVSPGRFAHPLPEERPYVWVEWKQEDGRWVVAALGEPAS